MTTYYETEEEGKQTQILAYEGATGRHLFTSIGDTHAQAIMCFRSSVLDYSRAYGKRIETVRMPVYRSVR